MHACRRGTREVCGQFRKEPLGQYHWSEPLVKRIGAGVRFVEGLTHSLTRAVGWHRDP